MSRADGLSSLEIHLPELPQIREEPRVVIPKEEYPPLSSNMWRFIQRSPRPELRLADYYTQCALDVLGGKTDPFGTDPIRYLAVADKIYGSKVATLKDNAEHLSRTARDLERLKRPDLARSYVERLDQLYTVRR
jgi:hypothetical protein